MAKRPTRSQADDGAAAAPSAKPRRRTASKRDASIEPSDTQAARASVAEEAPPDADRVTASEALTSESMASEPTEEDIRMRAYHRYLERGGGHGMDFEDWLEAERELRAQRSQQSD